MCHLWVPEEPRFSRQGQNGTGVALTWTGRPRTQPGFREGFLLEIVSKLSLKG